MVSQVKEIKNQNKTVGHVGDGSGLEQSRHCNGWLTK